MMLVPYEAGAAGAGVGVGMGIGMGMGVGTDASAAGLPGFGGGLESKGKGRKKRAAEGPVVPGDTAGSNVPPKKRAHNVHAAHALMQLSEVASSNIDGAEADPRQGGRGRAKDSNGTHQPTADLPTSTDPNPNPDPNPSPRRGRGRGKAQPPGAPTADLAVDMLTLIRGQSRHPFHGHPANAPGTEAEGAVRAGGGVADGTIMACDDEA
jgi:hypothetical protein